MSVPDRILVRGSTDPLEGRYLVQGSKLSALCVLAALPLCSAPVRLENVPALLDTKLIVEFLASHGTQIARSGSDIEFDMCGLTDPPALEGPVVEHIHGSVHLVNGLLARFGRVEADDRFGGCDIGDRSTAQMVKTALSFGARDASRPGRIVLTASSLSGTTVRAPVEHALDRFQSQVTKAALILGARAKGPTEIIEPYMRTPVVALAAFLSVGAGSKITAFDSTRAALIPGVAPTEKVVFRMPGDELEAITALALLAIRGGTLSVDGFNPSQCRPELELLRQFGVDIYERNDGVDAAREGALVSQTFSTAEIDTDVQPLLAAINLFASRGTAHVTEFVWGNRFDWAQQAKLFGAKIEIKGNRLAIDAGNRMREANVAASDLRSAATLINIAASIAGNSVVEGVSHLARGYAALLDNYRNLGIDVERLA